MNDSIGGISVKVSADTRDFDKDMDLVKSESRSVSNSLKSIGSSAASAGLSIAKWGAATAAAATVAAAAIYKSTLSSIRELRNQAMAAGMTVAEFERASFAARQYGIEQDKFADILKDVNERIGNFVSIGSGPMIDFFEQIAPKVGVTVEQFRKLNSKDALALYISSLEKANLSQDKMTFYMEAIASDSTRLIPLLSDNAKKMMELSNAAKELGIGMSDIEVEQAIKAQEELDKLAFIFDSRVKTAVANLSPVITAMLEEFTGSMNDMVSKSDLSFNQMMIHVQSFAVGIAKVSDAFRYIEIAIKGVELAVTGLENIFKGAIFGLLKVNQVFGDALWDIGTIFPYIADQGANAFIELQKSIGHLLSEYLAPLIKQFAELPVVGDQFKAASASVEAFGKSIQNTMPSNLVGQYKELAESHKQGYKNMADGAEEIFRQSLNDSIAIQDELRELFNSPLPSENVEAWFDQIIARANELRSTMQGTTNEEGTKVENKVTTVTEDPPALKPPELQQQVDNVSAIDAYKNETVGLLEAMGLRFASMEEMRLAEQKRELLMLQDQAAKEAMIISEIRAAEDELTAQHQAGKSGLTQEQYTAELEALRARREQMVNIVSDTQNKILDVKRESAETERSMLVSSLQEGFSALAGNSKKVQKFMQKVAIAQAGIKGAQAAVDAWQAGMSTGGPFAPLVAAAYTTASLARTAAMIRGIKSGGQAASSGGGGVPSVPQQQAPQQQAQSASPQRVFNVNMVGESQSSQSVRALLEMINEEVGNGLRIRMG